jgi:hypothetical protein
MLVWRGAGIFVVVLTVIAYLIAVQAGEHFWGTPLPAANRAAVELAGLLIAAALVFVLHIALDRTSAPRIVVDKATGQEIRLISKHDLFFVPVKFWPYILVALGVLFFFQH